VNHYCTYFDRNFLIHGMALARSLRTHDSKSVLWILCLDDFTYQYLEDCNDPAIRPVPLAELESADPALRAAKEDRSLVEYYFTLSPCWPRHLLRENPTMERVTYLDADLFFYGSPEPVFAEMGERSVFVTEHRYPEFLQHHARCGRFNVAILSFRNNAHGLRCLDRWREQCLDWCHDRVEDGKYADQGYLDEWPALLGDELCISNRAGVNLAPWNWPAHQIETRGRTILIDRQPLEIFHFARFRPYVGSFLFQSGQLEYGIMPWRVRQAIYGPYWRALTVARDEIRSHRPGFDFPRTRLRAWHNFWKCFAPRALFGSDWLRIGPFFISGRFGLGRFSGRIFNFARTLKQQIRQRHETPVLVTDEKPVS
jgi:hypothetical protein